jgi:hypothetical protein
MRPIYRDLLVLLIVALLGGVIGWVIKPCPTCLGTTVVEVHDSIAPAKDTGIIAINSQPKLKETKKYTGRQNYSYTSDTNKVKALEYSTANNLELSYISSCLDTNIFTVDTQAVDNFKAHATATVANNQLIGLLIEYQNLKPEKWKVLSKTVTVEKKQSLVKVYTGIYAGISIANKTVASYHGGVGLDAIISDRHLIGLQGGLNSSLQPEVGIRFSEKIRLKK